MVTSASELMIYQDSTGQLYLHLPVVPTVFVLLLVIGLIKITILSLGLFRKPDTDRDTVDLAHNKTPQFEDEGLEVIDDDRVPYEPKIHSNTQVRHIDL